MWSGAQRGAENMWSGARRRDEENGHREQRRKDAKRLIFAEVLPTI